jgi:hypothetical protein
MRQLLSLLAFFLFMNPVFPGDTRDNITVDDIINSLNLYTDHTSPHKLYLHLNKDHYNAGDAIWFKAYLLDSATSKPDTNRTNIYIDLINSEGVVMGKRLLLAEQGTAIGDMDLPPSIPDGNYMIHAYTDWMMNFDKDFYYKRYFYINNQGFKNYIPRLRVLSNRRFNRQLDRMRDNYEIKFFPEGGQLIEGVTNRVAFKSHDDLGQGVEVNGEILNSDKKTVVKFESEHAGFGSFEFTPRAGNQYHAMVSFRGGRLGYVDFPEVQSTGFSLRIDKEKDSILIKIASVEASGSDYTEKELLLVAQSGGVPVFCESLFVKEGKANLKIPETDFPSGVVHFTLFSPSSEPVAERILLIDHGDRFYFFPMLVSQSVDDREHYGLIIEVSDKDNNPVQGSFSVSLLAGEFEDQDPQDNIVSYTLLGSDLQGMVENSVKYLDKSKEFGDALDNLMLTYDWSRFSWNEVLSEKVTELNYPPPGLSITGRLTEPGRNESLGNYPVQIEIGDKEIYETHTNRRGIFEFHELVYYDETKVSISSKRLKDGTPPEIELYQAKTEGYEYVSNKYTMPNKITSRGSNWRRVSRVSRSPYAEAPELKALPGIYGTPDQTIFIDVKSVRQNTVYEVLLHNAKGIDFDGGRISFRGRTDLFARSEPMFMIDGVMTDRSVLLGMSPLDVQRIELFRGTTKAAFGSRGSNGVILAYSRRAADEGFVDQKEYMLMGYHTPNEFYRELSSPSAGSVSEIFRVRTIKWDPEVITGVDGQAIIPIPSIEGIGPVRLIIEGMGFDGGVGSGVFTLHYEK